MSEKLIKSKYEIQSLVSEDILSYTYIANEIDTDFRVIVWEFKRELIQPKLSQQLIMAAEKLIEVKHPNIIRLLDYEYDGQSFYTIHEFTEDVISLDALLIKKPKWTIKTVYQITKQVLEALKYLHDNDLVYGNLGLANIFLNQKLDAKLANAIIPSLIIRDNIDKISLLEECIFCPPELLKRKVLNKRSDVYAFGILLYFFYTSKWPYKYTQKILAMKRNLLKKPTHPSLLNEKVTLKMETIIERSISLEPEIRYQSASELYSVYIKNNQIDVPAIDVVENHIAEELKGDVFKARLSVVFGVLKNSIVVGGIIAVLGMFYLTYMNYMTEIPKVQVPKLNGLALGEVEKLLKSKKLQFEITGKRIHPLVPEGHILESKPPYGRDVKQNRKIRLIVSKGKGTYKTPKLMGRTIDQSKPILDSLGLEWKISGSEYAPLQKGVILSQKPTPNSEVAAETVIELVLSKGYPVSISYTKDQFNLSGETMLNVVASFKIQEKWGAQKVALFNLTDNETVKLHEDVYSSGEYKTETYTVPDNSYIEIYFNGELGLKQKL